jgi:hypothetical protein
MTTRLPKILGLYQYQDLGFVGSLLRKVGVKTKGFQTPKGFVLVGYRNNLKSPAVRKRIQQAKTIADIIIKRPDSVVTKSLIVQLGGTA